MYVVASTSITNRPLCGNETHESHLFSYWRKILEDSRIGGVREGVEAR